MDPGTTTRSRPPLPPSPPPSSPTAAAAGNATPDGDGDGEDAFYANRHSRRVLRDAFDPGTEDGTVQIVKDGSRLTADALMSSSDSELGGGGGGDGRGDGAGLSIHRPMLVKDTPESIGMVIPRGREVGGDPDGEGHNSAPVTMREIGGMVGMHYPVTVMDVRTQEELDGWTFGDLVDYFEDEGRVYATRGIAGRGSGSSNSNGPTASCPRPRVLNQISLEFSHTPLRSIVQSPAFVRDLDWIDRAWPAALRAVGDYPRVQYYCLTSTGGCYTDFHVDFGGTSVWYHVVTGSKVFLLTPPTPSNLKEYESWLCRSDQSEVFYPDLPNVSGTVRVTARQGQTLFIPAGWIHAVYTPEDSIVFGGNFLHGLDVPRQLAMHCLETRTRVPQKFRFPHFVRTMFYAGSEYVRRIRRSQSKGEDDGGVVGVCRSEVEGLPGMCDALRVWAVAPGGDADRAGSVAHAARESARSCGCGSAVEMADLLEAYVRTMLEAGGPWVGRKTATVNTTSAKSKKLKLRLGGASARSALGGASLLRMTQSVRVVSAGSSEEEGGGGMGVGTGSVKKKKKLKLRLSGGAGAEPPIVNTTAESLDEGLTVQSVGCPPSVLPPAVDNDVNAEFRISLTVPLPPIQLPLMGGGRGKKGRGGISSNDLSSAYGTMGGGFGFGGGVEEDDEDWVPGGGKKKVRGGKRKRPRNSATTASDIGAAAREHMLSVFRDVSADDDLLDTHDMQEETEVGVIGETAGDERSSLSLRPPPPPRQSLEAKGRSGSGGASTTKTMAKKKAGNGPAAKTKTKPLPPPTKIKKGDAIG